MEKEIIIAIIAAVTTMLTILGSIVVTVISKNAVLKEHQINADREMKRKYYNCFIDAYTKKLYYLDKQDYREKIEAEMNFILEANRLPLYASEEMVLFIESIKEPRKAEETKMEDFLIIMRRDLCETSFHEFISVKGISLVRPNKVLVTDFDGKNKIV